MRKTEKVCGKEGQKEKESQDFQTSVTKKPAFSPRCRQQVMSTTGCAVDSSGSFGQRKQGLLSFYTQRRAQNLLKSYRLGVWAGN